MPQFRHMNIFLSLPEVYFNPSTIDSVQRDFDIRELREFNKTIMKQIGEAVNQHPEITEAVNMYFAQVSTVLLEASVHRKEQGRGDHLDETWLKGNNVGIAT